MKRLEANDPVAMVFLGYQYEHGLRGLQQDYAKAKELYTRAADLGCSKAHIFLAELYHEVGNMKKAKFHNEAAAMAGNEVARYNLGIMEKQSGNMERAVKHLTIASSAGCYSSMDNLRIAFEYGVISRESIDSTLAAYNSSCAEMRSEARDACIQFEIDTIIMNNI
jgi:TPR repeat protein